MRMKIKLNDDQKIRIKHSDDLYKVIKEILLRQDECRRRQEYFWVIGLSYIHKIEFVELVALGRLNVVHVMPRDIFSYGIEIRCAHIVLIHNHPSGNLRPSVEDLFFTERMVAASLILDLKIEDHLIITEEGYRSFSNEVKIMYRQHKRRRANRPLIFDFSEFPGVGSEP